MSDGTLFDAPGYDDQPSTSWATLSPDGLYRYSLGRRWAPPDEEARWVTFVMLNPSTADAALDDPTIRRCRGFAQSWGAGGMHVVNLYAYRATSPAALWVVPDPVGPDNDRTLTGYAAMGWPMVAAWGANARRDRVAEVLDLIRDCPPLRCLGTTKAGDPRHPLYVKGDTPLTEWGP